MRSRPRAAAGGGSPADHLPIAAAIYCQRPTPCCPSNGPQTGCIPGSTRDAAAMGQRGRGERPQLRSGRRLPACLPPWDLVVLDHVQPNPDALGPAGRAAQTQRHVGAGEIQREFRDVDHRLMAAVMSEARRELRIGIMFAQHEMPCWRSSHLNAESPARPELPNGAPLTLGRMRKRSQQQCSAGGLADRYDRSNALAQLQQTLDGGAAVRPLC
jgi:hypothetical protein